jgi:hypothetical protein
VERSRNLVLVSRVFSASWLIEERSRTGAD